MRERWRRIRLALSAGVVITLISLPEALALSELAGLPPIAGVWAHFLPVLVYLVLRRQESVSLGLSAPVAVLLAASNEGLTPQGALARVSVVSLLVAAFWGLSAVLRLDFLARLVSRPILSGLALGMFVVLVAAQLGDLLGISVRGESAVSHVVSAVKGLEEVSVETLVVGASTVGILLLTRRRRGRVFSSASALAGGAALVALLGWDGSGGVEVIGPVDRGLPRPEWGALSWSEVMGLVPVASAVFIILSVESIQLGRGLVSRSGGAELDVRREAFSLAATNAMAALSSSMPIAGSTSATVAEEAAEGGRRAAGFIAAGCAGLLLLVGHDFRYLPKVSVAWVSISAMATLLNPSIFVRISRFDRRELGFALLAFAVTVAIGPVAGVILATGASILSLMRWTSEAHLSELQSGDGVLTLRREGALLMLNADVVTQEIVRRVRKLEPFPREVLLDLSAVPKVDFTAAEALRRLRLELDADGVSLRLGGASAAVGKALASVGLDSEGRDLPALLRALRRPTHASSRDRPPASP